MGGFPWEASQGRPPSGDLPGEASQGRPVKDKYDAAWRQPQSVEFQGSALTQSAWASREPVGKGIRQMLEARRSRPR